MKVPRMCVDCNKLKKASKEVVVTAPHANLRHSDAALSGQKSTAYLLHNIQELTSRCTSRLGGGSPVEEQHAGEGLCAV